MHLVKRLRDICDRERLKADSRALTALVGIAQGDLRGCLNTLQVCLLAHLNVVLAKPSGSVFETTGDGGDRSRG